jgi:hypothetical protein
MFVVVRLCASAKKKKVVLKYQIKQIGNSERTLRHEEREIL